MIWSSRGSDGLVVHSIVRLVELLQWWREEVDISNVSVCNIL